MSINGHWHQCNANRSPQIGIKKEISLSANSSIVIQHGCRTTWLWDSSIVVQFNYNTEWLWNSVALRGFLGEEALEWSQSLARQFCSGKMSLVFQLQPRKCSLQCKENMCSLSQWGADLYSEKSLLLIHGRSIFMQMRVPNPHNAIGPKALSFVTLLSQ